MNQITRCFEALYGQPSWGVQQGWASSLLLEFGAPHLEIAKDRMQQTVRGKVDRKIMRRITTVRGDWHLWIWCCNWVLQLDQMELAHSESSDNEIADALFVLNGQALTSVAIDASIGSSVFEFDLGGRLCTTPYEGLDLNNDPRVNWMLFEPSEFVLSYRADGKYSYQHKNSPVETEDWLTIL